MCREELVPALLFADDMVIFAEGEDELRGSLGVLGEWCREWGMKVNADKCGHHHKVQVAICASIHLCSLVNVLVVWYRKAPPVQVEVMTPWVQVEYLQCFDGRKQH